MSYYKLSDQFFNPTLEKDFLSLLEEYPQVLFYLQKKFKTPKDIFSPENQEKFQTLCEMKFQLPKSKINL